MGDELVLCVPSADVHRLFDERGRAPGCWWLAAEAVPDLGSWLAERAEFLRRSRAENDGGRRHLATYAVVTAGGKVFTYRRGVSGSEGRLHHCRSLGIGGHVTLDEDFARDRWSLRPAWMAMLDGAAAREIDEELEWGHVDRVGSPLRFAGLIADSSDAVGRVHLGVVYAWDRPDDALVTPREGCLEEPQWWTVEELEASSLPLESWSRIALENLLDPAPPPAAGPHAPEARP